MDKVFLVEFRHFLMLFWPFYYMFGSFSLYLVITIGKKSEMLNRRRKNIVILIKVDKGKTWIVCFFLCNPSLRDKGLNITVSD